MKKYYYKDEGITLQMQAHAHGRCRMLRGFCVIAAAGLFCAYFARIFCCIGGRGGGRCPHGLVDSKGLGLLLPEEERLGLLEPSLELLLTVHEPPDLRRVGGWVGGQAAAATCAVSCKQYR